MKLISIASAFPKQQYTQEECLHAMREADFWSELKPSSQSILTKVLQQKNGIKTRHFALDKLSEAWSRDAQQLNEFYEREAPVIAKEAALKALNQSSLKIDDIDALFICSCTGYLCPGLSSYVAERLGMKPNAYLQDLTGLGCGAAVPMLEAAAGYTALYPHSRVLTIAVEICSAAFFIENDIGVLISTCLFGDGASAAIWSGNELNEGDWEINHFNCIHQPTSREKIRFTNAGGKLRNQLHKSVPSLAADAVKSLYDQRTQNKHHIITHGGGRDVILAIEESLDIEPMVFAREVMHQYGNLSSPSVLIALEKFLAKNKGNDPIWLCGFGAGFSAHACELHRT